MLHTATIENTFAFIQ